MITSTRRAVIESPIDQGADEVIVYEIDTTPWTGASYPSNPIVKLYDNKRTDYSDTCLIGSPAINEYIISTSAVSGLTAGKLYRLEIKFDVDGNTLEAYCIINAEY